MAKDNKNSRRKENCASVHSKPLSHMIFSLIQELIIFQREVEATHNQKDDFCMSSVVKEQLPGNEERPEAIAA